LNYATWKLNFTNPEYGTGPEDKIAKSGIEAKASWVLGQPEDGGTILGYLSEPIEESKFKAWSVTNISESEALDFCLAINEQAYLLEDGVITAPRESFMI
jgi:hypothetical protein